MSMIVTVVIWRVAGANPLDMVVMAFLDHADLVLEAQHLLAILTVHAIHDVVAGQALGHAVGKGL